jgi:hypothetical protein
MFDQHRRQPPHEPSPHYQAPDSLRILAWATRTGAPVAIDLETARRDLTTHGIPGDLLPCGYLSEAYADDAGLHFSRTFNASGRPTLGLPENILRAAYTSEVKAQDGSTLWCPFVRVAPSQMKDLAAELLKATFGESARDLIQKLESADLVEEESVTGQIHVSATRGFEPVKALFTRPNRILDYLPRDLQLALAMAFHSGARLWTVDSNGEIRSEQYV